MNDVSHVNTFIQAGGVAALMGDQAPVQAMVDEDRRRRDMVCQQLNAMLGVRCPVPASTIYAWADIRGTGHTSQALADLLLERVQVVVESGAFYGPAGEGYIRICFGGESYERLHEAMQRMATVIT